MGAGALSFYLCLNWFSKLSRPPKPVDAHGRLPRHRSSEWGNPTPSPSVGSNESAVNSFRMTIPPWLTAGATLSAISAWIGLYITVRKHRSERPILKFVLKATHVEADEDEPTRMFVDGMGVVPALFVTITNVGKQPVTVFQTKCKYSATTNDGTSCERESTDYVNKKLGEGDHCFASPRVAIKGSRLLSARAVDFTSRVWKVPRRLVRRLNLEGLKAWQN